ncbi:MAG: SCO family protein [Planctomycetota bacterium]
MAHPFAITFLSALAVVGASMPSAAQVAGKKIDALEGVTIEQKLNAELPKDAQFTTDSGERITLGELFDGSLPVVLTLNYTDCPQLCSVHLTKLVEALGVFSAKLAPGTGYRLITICIDPKDTPEKAARMKAEYVTRLATQLTATVPEVDLADARVAVEAEAAAAWTFLVADEATIARVADAVGFGYKWLPAQKEFAHQAATILCTPDGRVARYVGGIDPIPGVLRMSLVEASEGKVGSLFDGIFLSCFIYDPHLGSYALAARRVMTAAGALMVVGVLTGFFFLKRSEARAASGTRAAEESVR